MALQGNFATAIGNLVTSLTAGDMVNINETIFQETFPVGSFAQAHTLITDRRSGNLQAILASQDYYGSMPVGDQTSCDLNSCDITPVFSTKEWCLAEYNCRMEICMRSFDEDFLIFWNMYRQQLEDPTQEPDAQAFLNYIEMVVKNRIQGTQWRVGYWGDTSKTENALVNGCDGFFAQVEAGGGEKVILTSAGSEPTALEIYTAMQEAYEKGMASTWAGNADVVWKTTYAVAAKLVTWLNTMGDTGQYNCDCLDPNGIVGARRFNIDGLTIFGIRVEAHREIDLSMAAAGETDPYRIILTSKSNLLEGVNTANKMEGFEIFYDRISRKVFIDSIVKLGTMVPTDDYVYITEAAISS